MWQIAASSSKTYNNFICCTPNMLYPNCSTNHICSRPEMKQTRTKAVHQQESTINQLSQWMIHNRLIQIKYLSIILNWIHKKTIQCQDKKWITIHFNRCILTEFNQSTLINPAISLNLFLLKQQLTLHPCEEKHRAIIFCPEQL